MPWCDVRQPYALKGVTSALTDVDTAGWTQRFVLLSDPNRLEILLCLHRAPGICVGDLAAALVSVNPSPRRCGCSAQGWVSSTGWAGSVSYRLEDEIVHDLLHWIAPVTAEAARSPRT